VIAVLVAIGGGLGAVLRYWIGSAVQAGAGPGGFPLGTLAVNVVGCLAIGVVSALADRRGDLTAETRAFLVVGVLGGFTTFSAFANDNMYAVRSGAAPIALLNVLSSVGLCLAAVWGGRGLVAWWAR
jgi:CrcB protein